MEEKYINLIRAFKKLDIEDKKEEIIKKLYELINLLYLENKKIDSFNVPLGILNNYTDEDSYYDLLFSCIMTIREENAKLIEKIENI